MAHVRATRAYIAGFGTAGSLLAGAAIVFFFASAVVSFRGWPQVGGQATPVAVLAGHERPASSHTQVRRFAAVISGPAARATGPVAATAAASSRVASARQTTAILAATPVGSPGGHRPSFTSTTPGAPGVSTPPATPPCGTCGAPTLGTALGAATQAATNTLGTTVASAGGQLGSVVSGLTGVLGGRLGALSSSAAQIVSGTGRALGGTLGSATGNLGGALSGAGKGLSGILARH